ncbi:MAG: hypothetical protein F4X56_00075 [Gammaproteobacteria bacterium]|nr:hypothetical protein [Gammaproteobacteria bacterium]
MSPGEDVFLSHGVLARLPVNLDALGSIAQQRYAVNPKYDEFIETGNINLNWLADAIGELPEGANPDRIWGDYLSAQQGSDILGLQWAAQRARERLKQRYRQSRFELHSLDDSDDVDRLNAELRELAEDEQIFFDQNFVFNSEDAGEAPREPNPEILFGPDPAADPIPESVPDLLFESELEAFASDISAGHEQAMSFQRGRGLGLGQRISRGFSEAVGERAWGGVLSQIQLVTQDAAVMHTVASLAWEGTRVALGDTLNFGSLIHAGASSMVALGMKAADARLGYRGVLPESRIDLEELGVAVENVPAEAGKHLQRIFSDAGAGTFRWGRGSLSRELERYDPEALVSMFGESGADYLQEFAYQTRRFGQRSHQTQRSLRQGLFDFVTGSIPRSRRYVYDPETREVDVRTGRRGRLDQLLEAGEGRFGGLGLWDASLGAWHQRREYARSGLDVIPDETGDEGIRRSLGVWFAKQAMEYDDDASFFFAKASLAMYPTERKRGRLSSVLDRVFGPLQGEDATPHGLYMTLPIARGLGRMWGRFHAAKPFEQQGLRVDLENLDHVVRRWGAPEWADRIAQRKEHRRERENIFEERRTAPELYQWQDPEHFFSEITGMLGVDVPDFDGFAAQRLGSPYSRFGRHFSRLPKGAKYPLIGGGVGVGGKLLYETFFGEDEPEELVLQDPVGYSVSPRYPVLGALQRTRPYRRLRARAENLLDDVYGEDSFHSEMLKSMVLGKKRNLPEETKGTFLQTGQVHVLTQSGMHVSMFSNILSRYPLLAAPAIFLAAKDAISPPNETVVEPSQSILDRYRLKDSPWTPRWNPPVWDSRFDPYSTEYDPDWKPPAWAWWDTSKYSPLSRGYRGRSERPQPPGMLRAEFSGVQDVLPWTMYSMFGVLPESVYAFRQQSQQQQRVEDVVRAREEFQPVVTETPSLLNLNRATVSDLDALPGISKFYAERIIEHREDLGGFERVEDLLDVRGIGEKTFEQIRPLVNLGAVEKQVTDPEEGYSIDGFEFDVQESPFPGFNPWLDPHPEGSLKNEGIRQLSAELDGEKKGIFSRLWSVLGGEPERDLSLRVELPPIPKQHWQFLGAASFDEKRVGDLYESLSPGDIDPIPVDLARSVVKLKSVGESGKGGWGTGFFVDENIVATNYHMLAPMLTERDGEKGYWTGGSSIFVPGEDGPQEYSVGSVLGVSQSDDVALLRVDSVEGITPLELGSQGVSVTPTRRGFAAEDNTILRTMGYPSGVGEAPQLDVGRIGRKERDMDTPYAYTLADFFLDDIYAFGGESGSPIFGPDDKVYGILFGGIDTDEGIGAERTVVGTHSSDIQKLLDRVLRSPRSSQSVVDDFSTYEEVGWDSFDETLYKMGQLTSRRMQPLSEEFSATWDFQHGLPGIGSNLFVGAGYGIGEGLRGESQLQDNDVASLLRYPANSVVNQGERHPAYQSVVNIEMQSQWLDWLDPPPMGNWTG